MDCDSQPRATWQCHLSASENDRESLLRRKSLFLSSWFRCGREDSVQTEIQCRHPVVVRPTASQSYECPGSWPGLAVEPRNALIQLRVIGFCQRCVAKIKRSLEPGNQLILVFCSFELLVFGLRNIACVRTEEVVARNDVGGQMTEGQLLRCRFVAELVRRHFFEGCDHILFPACEHLTQNIRDRRLRLLSQNRGGQKSKANLDLTPDGQRMVVLSPVTNPDERQASNHVTFMLNFFDEVQRRVHQIAQ